MTPLALDLAVILVLILLNGAFAMAELSIVSARKARLKQAAERGGQGAEVALTLQAEPTRFLSTVQIGITLIGIITGAVGGERFGERLEAAMAGVPFLAPFAQPLGFALAVIGISYLTLIFGELLPKRLALLHPESLAIIFARPMALLGRIGAPFAWLLSASTDLLLRLLPKKPAGESAVTDEEIKLLIQEGAAAGDFEQAEAHIVARTLGLDARKVAAIMTPRIRLEVLDIDAPADEIRKTVLETRFTRFPVVRGDFEHVLGVAETRDILAMLLQGGPFNLADVARKPVYLPDTCSALQAIDSFRTSPISAALVVDEYGEIQGMLTLTDVMESLVGDLSEDGALDTPGMVQRTDGSWLVDGIFGVHELKDRLGLKTLPEEESGAYQTVGGLMMTLLNRIPQAADLVEYDGWRFEVMDMDGRRVDKVLITPPPEPADAA